MAAVSVSIRHLERTLSQRCSLRQCKPLLNSAAGRRSAHSQCRRSKAKDVENGGTILGSIGISLCGWRGYVYGKGRGSALNSVFPNSSAQQNRLISSSSRRGTTKRPTLPIQFLEAYDDAKFDPSTHQRNDVPFDPIDGKPPLPPHSQNDGANIETKHASWNYSTENDEWCMTKENEDSGSHTISYSNKWMSTQEERWRADANDFDQHWSSSDAITMKQEDVSATKRILWSNWTESTVRDPATSPILFEYDNLTRKNAGSNNLEHERLLKVLYRYGLVLITGTPTYTESLPSNVMSEATKNFHSRVSNTGEGREESAESAILHLASIIGYHPLQTLYGSGVWSTSSHYNVDGDESEGSVSASSGTSASTADSAYGFTSLPLHTDMNYLTTPPGVQVFLMVQPASAGESSGNNMLVPKGQSTYMDGFAAAQQLLLENPEAFRILATTPRRYRCVDDAEGWHLEATGPVIDTVPSGKNEWGPVRSIRHNDLDRLPDLPPYPGLVTAKENEMHNDLFYQKLREAHDAWDDIIRRDSMRLVIDLQPGDCVLVSNQRCMHGRCAFESSEFPRVVMGCYVGIDELSSKWRNAGLRVL